MAVAKAIGAARIIGVGGCAGGDSGPSVLLTAPRPDINAERLAFAKSYAATDIFQPVRSERADPLHPRRSHLARSPR